MQAGDLSTRATFQSPAPSAVATPTDRSLSVPPGKTVQTGYVAVNRVRLGCRDRMGCGDVETAYRRQLALGDHQAWPCPVGQWDGDEFVIHDGRHAYVAALMIGLDHVLVAWIA